MTAKKTPWFDGSVKPVRVGVYQRRYSNGLILYSLWDGARWMLNAETANEAAGTGARWKDASPHQFIPWRGLASDPGEA